MHEQPFDEPLLAEFFAELRSWGTGPAPAPNAPLASLLDAAPTPATIPHRRKRKMLTTKLAGLGIAAKAALGVGVAAAAVTTAGATGVLPPPAQHAVASVVDTLTGLQLPDPTVNVDVDAGGNASIPDVSVPDVSIPGQDDADDAGDDNGTAGQGDNHGACVSAVARDKSTTGREHGQAVSAVAKSDCGKEGATTSSSSTTSTSSTSSTSSSIPGSAAIADDGGQRGQGNGNRGNGSGNSGHGNSGNAGNAGNSGNSGDSGRSGRS